MRTWLDAHARFTASVQLGTMKAIACGFAGGDDYTTHAEQLFAVISPSENHGQTPGP